MEKIIVLIIAIVTYGLIIAFSHKKAFITLGASALLIILGILSPKEAIFTYVNKNVLMIYIGSLILADLFLYSKVPGVVADIIVNKAPNTGLAIVFVCMITGFISMFVENVATLLVMAPLAFEISKKLKVSPVPFLISLAISSNLQGTATLVGDPPSMIFAGFAGYSFNDFFIHNGKLSIFFIVQAGALVSWIFLYFYFKKYSKKEMAITEEKILSFVPTALLVLMVIGLASISFIEKGFSDKSGYLCMILGIIGLGWFFLFQKKTAKEVREVVQKLDWDSILFLIGIFIVIGSISKVGLLTDLANWMGATFGHSLLLSFIVIVSISVLISGFVDNVPYIIIMLPVASHMASLFGTNPEMLMFGLLVGACLGGNVTLFGASANIVAVGMLKKRGHQVNFMEFAKIGLPFTVLSTLFSALAIWYLWK